MVTGGEATDGVVDAEGLGGVEADPGAATIGGTELGTTGASGALCTGEAVDAGGSASEPLSPEEDSFRVAAATGALAAADAACGGAVAVAPAAVLVESAG